MTIKTQENIYYHQKFKLYQKQMSKHLVKEMNDQGKSFEKFKEELGVKEITLMKPPPIPKELLQFGGGMFGRETTNYTYQKAHGVSEENNNVRFSAGMTIYLNKQIALKIGSKNVDVISKDGAKEKDLQEAYSMAYSLNRLIRYANDQSGSLGFDKERRKSMEVLLNKLGLNTDETININGVDFDTKSFGYLEKVGVLDPNFTFAPTYVVKNFFESYGFEF